MPRRSEGNFIRSAESSAIELSQKEHDTSAGTSTRAPTIEALAFNFPIAETIEYVFHYLYTLCITFDSDSTQSCFEYTAIRHFIYHGSSSRRHRGGLVPPCRRRSTPQPFSRPCQKEGCYVRRTPDQQLRNSSAIISRCRESREATNEPLDGSKIVPRRWFNCLAYCCWGFSMSLCILRLDQLRRSLPGLLPDTSTTTVLSVADCLDSCTPNLLHAGWRSVRRQDF